MGVKTAVDIFRTEEMLHLVISWEEALGSWGALAGNSHSTAAREPRTRPHQQKLRINTRTKERGKTGPGGEPQVHQHDPIALAQWSPLSGSWGGTSAGCGCDSHQSRLFILKQPDQNPALCICAFCNTCHRKGTKAWPCSPSRSPRSSPVTFGFRSLVLAQEQHHPSKGKHIKSQDCAKAEQQQEEVSSCLFPEERLYSTNDSNKLPAIRLAVYPSHSGFSFLKGPVALHNIDSL